MQPQEHRETRYRILKALRYAHPYKMTELAILRAIRSINPELTENDIASEIVYLREKGYITTDQKFVKALREHIRLHKISPTGMDLTDGNLPGGDPGIDVPDLG